MTTYDLADLTLVVATPAQTRQTGVNTFDFWGRPRGVDLDAYLRRNEELEKGAWAREGQFRTWILVPWSTVNKETGESSASADEIISHVETYRRPAFSSAPGSSTPSDAVAYGIASVFTPAQFRRKGCGKRMLQLLHYVLALPEHLPPFPPAFGSPPPTKLQDGLFSVLYSDVGEKFYRTCSIGQEDDGWVEQGSVGHEWVVGAPDEKAPEGWAWLEDEESVTQLEQAVDEDLKSKVVSGLAGDQGRTRVGFSSTQELLGIHVRRSTLLPPFHPSQPPSKATSFGLFSPSTSSAIFYYPSNEAPPYKGPWSDPPRKTLLITATCRAVPWAVVEAAARREGCGRIEIWGEERLDADWPEGKKFIRDEHLSQLAWYGPATESPPQLVFNQKYAWC